MNAGARTPSEIRTVVLMMTDSELLDLIAFFRLGLLHFLNELIMAERAVAPADEHGSRPGR